MKNSRIWIQDGDPFQNSAVAREAMEELDAQLFPIPPKSLYTNCLTSTNSLHREINMFTCFLIYLVNIYLFKKLLQLTFLQRI